MPKDKSKYNALLKQLASTKILENVKSFISGLYDQLGALQASSFKPEHRDEFISLRAQFRDLVNQTRVFCDKAIPSLEYALSQLKPPHFVDVKVLAEEILSKLNPNHILEQCQQLENKILTFNDRISTDDYYKKSKIIPFLCFGAGAALAIASLISLVYIPMVLEIEMAVLASGSVMANVTVPSIILTSGGLAKVAAENDFEQYKIRVTEAINFIFEMKNELSNVTQNHGRLEIQLDHEDIRDLQPIYENLLNNMQDIRTLCLKPFPT